MTAMSDFLENEFLDHIMRNEAYTSPTNTWAALHTGDPGEASPGINEVVGNGYTRIQLGAGGVIFSVAASGTTDNDTDITFPTATGNQGTITHASIWDAASGGNMLLKGALVSSKTISSGDVFRFLAGELDITMD